MLSRVPCASSDVPGTSTLADRTTHRISTDLFIRCSPSSIWASPADFEVGLSQSFELGGRGGSRRDADTAALAREEADAAQVERDVLREVRIAFVRGLHAAERLRQARSLEAGAAELERIVRRRHETGDVADLDLNVASSARARSDSSICGTD